APRQAAAHLDTEGASRAPHSAREPPPRVRAGERTNAFRRHAQSAACRRVRFPVSPFQRLRQIALAIILTWGWKRAVVAMSAGALSVLALAPFNAWPVLFVTFPVLVWLIDGTGAGRLGGVPAAALTGYWFGLGYFVPGLYWIGFAFFVDADTFAWLTPFAVLGL